MTEFPSPYGFAPLNREVVFADWAFSESTSPKEGGRDEITPAALHDRPFVDGLEGSIDLRIEAETPIFTRGTADASQFLRLPDGRYAIAGSSLRGAIRNLVEIAAFAKLSFLNDHRYAVRDLHNADLYVRHMASIMPNARTGKNEPMPRVEAGWLQRAEGYDADASKPDTVVATLTPCDYAKIDYKTITDIAQGRARRFPASSHLASYDPGRKQSAPEKYDHWHQGCGSFPAEEKSRRLKVSVAPIRARSTNFLTEYGRVTGGGGQGGTLVFTGQPQRHVPSADRNRRAGAGNPKHHDFVFLDPKDSPPAAIPVERSVFRDFEFAHKAGGEQHGLRGLKPNEEWGYWKKRFDQGRPVPVFFLRDGARLRAIGLAMMFRLAYKRSVPEAANHGQSHRLSPRPDLAEAIFGYARGQDKDWEAHGTALRGRLSFSHAVEPGVVTPGREVRAVLSTPKASFYPAYVEQSPKGPGGQPDKRARSTRDGRQKTDVTWRTFMDEDAQIRGWKRYRPRERVDVPPLPRRADGTEVKDETVTRFHPLPAGTRFTSRLDFHNLRPLELGAVVWALTLGGDPEARHTLGMARPLGFGRCRIHLDLDATFHELGDERSWTLRACRDAFEAFMESRIPGWRQSDTIRELLALSHIAPVEQTRYPVVTMDGRTNEFSGAKKLGLALGRISPAGSPPPRAARPTPGPVPTSAPVHTAAPARRAGWPGMSRGSTLRVRLVETNKKGKWRCEAVEYEARGVIANGQAPEGAAAGQVVEVLVELGRDGSNLGLAWRP